MKGFCAIVSLFAANLVGSLFYMFNYGVDVSIILWGIAMIIAGLLFSMAGYFYGKQSIHKTYFVPKWAYYLFVVTLLLYLAAPITMMILGTLNALTLLIALGMATVALFLSKVGKLIKVDKGRLSKLH